MDSVGGGGGSSRHFLGSIFCGGGGGNFRGSSRNFPGSIFCGVTEFFPSHPIRLCDGRLRERHHQNRPSMLTWGATSTGYRACLWILMWDIIGLLPRPTGLPGYGFHR